jgi:membrane-associated protease RseP (regulator of RpoE activity)
MSKNMGSLDRGLRILVGLLLIAYAIPIGFPATGWNWAGWIGVVPLLTAIVGICPAYALLGVKSCAR